VRTVSLNPDLDDVNVVAGDVIRFVSGAGEFAWRFKVSPVVAAFDLNQAAPPGTLGRVVQVIVEPDPRDAERTGFNNHERQDSRVLAPIR
jgi:hypothetical protein